MRTIQGEVSEISLNGRPFSVDAEADISGMLHGFDNELKADGNSTFRLITPGNFEISGEWDMKIYPAIRPRRNGRDWSRRAYKKKINKNWEHIVKKFKGIGK